MLAQFEMSTLDEFNEFEREKKTHINPSRVHRLQVFFPAQKFGKLLATEQRKWVETEVGTDTRRWLRDFWVLLFGNSCYPAAVMREETPEEDIIQYLKEKHLPKILDVEKDFLNDKITIKEIKEAVGKQKMSEKDKENDALVT
ncbi:hypothetical protein L345_08222, partial [Ophiophagus hannah]